MVPGAGADADADADAEADAGAEVLPDADPESGVDTEPAVAEPACPTVQAVSPIATTRPSSRAGHTRRT
ncbi:MAG: hypothetical protein U0R72_06330 [Nakamurella multipartita]